jgi:hypothetical protein
MAGENIPAPPSGYVMQGATGVPPPPPGYQVQGAAAQPPSSSSQLPTAVSSPTADDYRSAGMSVPANLRSGNESWFQQLNDQGNDVSDSIIHNTAKMVIGPAQFLQHGITAATDAVLPAGNSVRQYVDSSNAGNDASISQNEAQYQRDVPNNIASYIGATIGNVAPFLFEAPAKALSYIGDAAKVLPKASGFLGKASNLGNEALSGAVQGGLIGATAPVTDTSQGYGSAKLRQIGKGVAIGAAAPVAAAIPGALKNGIVGTIDSQAQQLAKKASDYGIDLTAPQLSTSTPMKVLNSVTGQFPFSGAQSFAAKQQGQFNNAIAQEIGLPAGTTKITPDVFNEAYGKASSGFNDLWANNHLPVDGSLLSKTVQIANEASDFGASDNAGHALNATINRIVDVANKNGGVIPGRTFQSIDSLLGKTAMQPGTAGHYAGEMQDELRNAMQDSMSPADAGKLQLLRQQWQNLKQLTPIVAKQTDGNIPPNALMGAVTSNGAGKAAMARGLRGSMGDLANIGKRFLGNTYQDSGTAARVATFDTLKALGGAAAGAGVAGPGALLPLAGAAGVSRGIQSALRSRSLYNALANQAPAQVAKSQNALSRLAAPLAIRQMPPQLPQANYLSANQYTGTP